MPWKEVSVMSAKREFVVLADQAGANMRALCRRFGISAPTGYKWLGRHRAKRYELSDRSRRPRSCPSRTTHAVEQRVLEVRDEHPAWGARKIKARLRKKGFKELPAASTIHAILQRHGRIDPVDSLKHQAWQRFEHAAPTQLWQMDFKGSFALDQGRCFPLTILDDHSRFSIALEACAAERASIVQDRLTRVFRRYGLPERITVDNGAPWGSDADRQHTRLTAWLLRIGVAVSHSRPFHPQTQGKDERFHRTLAAELLRYRHFRDLSQAQTAFDSWRDIYNCERPHEALAMEVPATRYQLSARAFPEVLPSIEYGPSDTVRIVDIKGHIHIRGHRFLVSKAFTRLPVAIRPSSEDGVFDVFFCHQRVRQLDFNDTQDES